jgi:hypothetical protein
MEQGAWSRREEESTKQGGMSTERGAGSMGMGTRNNRNTNHEHKATDKTRRR